MEICAPSDAIAHSIKLAPSGAFSGFISVAPPSLSVRAEPLWGNQVRHYPEWVMDWHRGTAHVAALGCYVLRGGLLSYPGGVTFDDRLLTDASIAPPYVTDSHRDADVPAGLVEITHPTIIAVDRGLGTYGHLLIDVLPRLIIAKQALGERFREHAIFLPEPLPSWVRPVLKLALNVPEEQFVTADWKANRIRFDILIVPTMAHHNYRFHPYAKTLFSELKMAALDERYAPPGQKIFHIRRGGSRHLTNRDKIEAIASSFGLTLFDARDHAWPDQVATYSTSTLFVGEYGSALHNSIFMPPGSRVLALHPFQFLQSFLGAVNRERTMYLLKPGATVGLTQENAYEVDAEAFRRALDFALTN